MLIECTNCHSRYRLDESRLNEGEARFKCSKCGELVVVGKAGQAAPGEDKSMNEKKRIIVADDTAFFRAMLSDMLTEAGYEVITANDGEEAFTKIKHELPNVDLLLLDMLMPKMDGFQLIEQLRKGAMGKNLPILALSGVFKSESDREHMKSLGVSGYIDKDTPPEQILNRVKMLLSPEG
ncbi:MAG: zinc-ribbon domain-containing protein [Deltaproteobacteria bacterium]|nr:zinc-ribbon domain-containing protein [Deltaproteobacteria bacterium]